MPAPPPPTGSFARTTITGVFQGQVIENTLVYQATSLAGSADADAFHTAWTGGPAAAMVAAMPLFQTTDYLINELWSQIYTPTATYVRRTTAVGANGSTAPPSLPAEVAFVTKKVSALAGRKFRGRNFWTGISAGSLISALGTWNPVFAIPFATLVNGYYTTQVATLFPIRVWNPVIADQKLQHATPITGGTFDFVPRAQRRRQIGKGI